MAQWWKRSPPKKVNSGPVSSLGSVIFGLSLWLAFALLRVFFSRFSGFPPSTKTNAPNSNSPRIEDPHENQLRLKWFPLFVIHSWLWLALGLDILFSYVCEVFGTNQFSLFLAELITWWRQQRERARVRENRAPIMSRACVPDMRGERVRYPTP